MKKIDTFGAWLLDTKSGLVFGCLLLLSTAGILGFEYMKKAETVTLSSKDFTCVASEPHGLGTRCTDYRRVR